MIRWHARIFCPWTTSRMWYSTQILLTVAQVAGQPDWAPGKCTYSFAFMHNTRLYGVSVFFCLHNCTLIPDSGDSDLIMWNQRSFHFIEILYTTHLVSPNCRISPLANVTTGFEGKEILGQVSPSFRRQLSDSVLLKHPGVVWLNTSCSTNPSVAQMRFAHTG